MALISGMALAAQAGCTQAGAAALCGAITARDVAKAEEVLRAGPVDWLRQQWTCQPAKDAIDLAANQGNHAVRTAEWRYIRYAHGSEELYDRRRDPNEWTNLAQDPKQRGTAEALAKWLPRVDRPAVPGSVSRAITTGEHGEWLWEGTPIVPARIVR